MSKATEKQLKEYYSEVSKAIPCPAKQKKAFIKQFRSDIDAFLSDNPNATADEVIACFGSADSIAQSFISNSDVKKIKSQTDIKKLILAAIIVALVIYLAFVIISLIDVHTEAHGYFREGIMLIDSIGKVAAL